uniref:Uncharacterized protein n=1 Tax=Chromera velia CCMP2878 TaxID=1169474 RepID=A0A0G4I0S5_9ALVE|eukprot:Cvel_9991.t1-p1 / transcript=Cvel_9991.t1 / gene=Cvel_9991 / organism=Chromera_velia_CCMP2878 / gene_product=hypothetical protein / transcript_product=hypothetical protein / location=Cvel_scaffold591:38368-40943(-) / protein_length=647 / sequence_SO=supercontig / SO=protein_coding / is_pseudo=false
MHVENLLDERLQKYSSPTDRSTGLFSDSETYKNSLPVRRVGTRSEALKLYKLPYWGSEEDLGKMVKMLSDDQTGNRYEIKYLCAPGRSGKTSSVLPAFLASEDFTHYLYLAFDNNGRRRFQLSNETPLLDGGYAKNQGAAFAVECMRALLEEPDRKWPYEVPVGPGDLPPSVDDSIDEMESLLHRNLGENARVLIHLDDHRKMCPRTNQENDPGAAFSQGAMEVFAERAVAVATYVEPPPLTPPTASTSATCRWPVVCPRIDVELVMRHLADSDASRFCSGKTGPLTGFSGFLKLKQTSTDPDEQRLIANLQLRFALALEGNLSRLHVPAVDKRLERQVAKLSDDLKAACSSKRSKTDRKAKLRKAADTFSKPLLEKFFYRYIPREVDKHVAGLLCGLKDEEVHGVRRVSNLIVLGRDDLLTAPLYHLLSVKPPDDEPELQNVYVKGAGLFKEQFQPAVPLLAGTPLERSYLWALSTESALYGGLLFGAINCPFKCTDIKKGRIFPGQNQTNFDTITDVSQLETDIMFFADEEKDGKPFSHPRCDMWFRTSDGEMVVLIEITDAHGKKVKEKAERLGEVVRGIQVEQKEKESGVRIRGVVLAPSDSEGASYESSAHEVQESEVAILRTDRARKLLGGLDHVFQYVKP